MKAVIFDFDGTIADSLLAVVEVAETITKRKKPFSHKEIAQFQHMDALQIALSVGVKKWQIPWLFFKGRRMMHEHLQAVPMHEGMAELIRQLHKAGVPLYVLTSNSSANVTEYLRQHKLETCFRHIYGGAGALSKARKFYRLFDKEHIDVEGSWYVGDVTRDIIAAHAVGLRIISVSWGYNSRAALEAREPDELVDTPSQILDILKRDGELLQ